MLEARVGFYQRLGFKMKFIMKSLLAGAAILLGMLSAALAQTQPFAAWQHAGSLHILTTPDGANLPASASENDFPLLVRLQRDFFDFSQAKVHGEDIRFSTSTGQALEYQIEEWNAANGTASIWVRIPSIKGNARQELKMFWGKSDAVSGSSGSAVFNESNGYLSVWHMDGPVQDEVGTLESKDAGTTATAGMVGQARHFAEKGGIFCGDKITNYPSGATSHSTEAWFRIEKANATIIGWGNEGGNRGSKVRMQFRSPPHIHVDSDFSDVNGESTLPMSEWIHVVHTYSSGDGKIYINGKLDGSATPTLNIKSPARMWIGGWYNNYDFIGDIDEVRISKVARSANWVRLQYENQKPQQTAVGLLVQPGSDFSVSENNLTLLEGKSATVSAKAGGAQKIYWILKRGGQENIVAVDRWSYTVEAGRVAADESLTLQFKAIYANAVKTVSIPVTIQENIPEPVFTLQASATWDGRKPIEVVPQISNLKAMQAKGAGKLNYTWAVSDIAALKEIAAGKLILKRAQNSGKLTVTATVDNGGQPTTQTIQILVTETKRDAWVSRPPAKDEKPVDNQFYARDDKNEGTLFYNGTLNETGDAVFLKVYADDKLIKNESQKIGSDKTYAFSVKLKPGLIKYKVEFGTRSGNSETVLHTVTNLVCGDAYLIQGQSNALATDTREKSPPETSDWIRSYGSPPAKPNGIPSNEWCNPVWKAQHGEPAELGWWGMELAKRLVASQQIPICIINGAVGGTRIDQHQRNEADPTDLTTIYGRALWRVQQAGLTHGIRGILWHQGENNQGSASPAGDYDWKSYQDFFVELSSAWKQDFPNVQHYYVFQIWPNACSMSGNSGCGNMIREIQRRLPRLYSNMSVMSTVGTKPPGGCHFPLAGWSEFARSIQPLIERDNYAKVFTQSITPPNLKQAGYTSAKQDEIALEFDQPVVWTNSLVSQFHLDGQAGKVISGNASGNVLTLKLTSAASAKTITYLDEKTWSNENLLYGQNGIAALTFCEVPLASTKPSR